MNINYCYAIIIYEPSPKVAYNKLEARSPVFDALTYFKITKTRFTDTYPPPGFYFWGTGNQPVLFTI